MKEIIVVLFLLLVSCSSSKHINLIQKKDSKQLVEFFFYNYKEGEGKIVLRKEIILKNPYWSFADVKINYFKNEQKVFGSEAYPTEFYKKEYRKIKNDGELHKIKLLPRGDKEIIYTLSKEFYVNESKVLSFYANMSNVIDTLLKTRSYQEPFSEFKRKNPELLEFLTKGDSIELEVISPVKQKYKFKAEW
ncbi:hypothetical protein ACI75Y_12975 [Capnocytophaga stomatis]|uniref:hypothetical protein n=1 Tax=Capnocytophaga stomatis TaxID=1848904 RepID=UPI00385BF0D3